MLIPTVHDPIFSEHDAKSTKIVDWPDQWLNNKGTLSYTLGAALMERQEKVRCYRWPASTPAARPRSDNKN